MEEVSAVCYTPTSMVSDGIMESCDNGNITFTFQRYLEIVFYSNIQQSQGL